MLFCNAFAKKESLGHGFLGQAFWDPDTRLLFRRVSGWNRYPLHQKINEQD